MFHFMRFNVDSVIFERIQISIIARIFFLFPMRPIYRCFKLKNELNLPTNSGWIRVRVE
jgi:hypothetical protein